LGEGVAPPLFGSEDVIVRLMLKASISEFWFQVTAQEGNPVSLVGVAAKSHPNEMNVIGHQDVNGTKQSFSRAGVEQQLAETRMESVVKPAGAPACNGHSPQDDGIALTIGPV
jgi:hypothetical protein